VLPDNCDSEAASIQAKHENGLLKITLPKSKPDAAKAPTTDVKIN